MKNLPKFLFGVLLFVVVYLIVSFVWDGEIVNWKKDILQSIIVGSITMAGLINFGRKREE